MMKEKKEKSTKKRDVRSKEKWEKGITLIALVITIIVLLILAAVSIATLTGENGILTRAGDARDNTRGASVQEAIDLWRTNQKADYFIGSGTAQTKEQLLDDLESQKLLVGDERSKLEAGETITIGNKNISLKVLADEVEVGDYIKYGDKLTAQTYDTNTDETGYTSSQTFETNTSMLWRVINKKDNGEVEIVAVSNVLANDGNTGLYLQGQNGYINAEKVLEDLCKKLYTNTSYGTGRSINVEDINTLTGFDPETSDYEDKDYYNTTKTYTSGGPFWDKSSNTFKTPTTTNPITVENTYYWYAVNESMPLYDTLIAESKTYSGDYSETNYPLFYWLGSRCIEEYGNRADFGVRVVAIGGVIHWTLFSADTTGHPGEDAYARAVRPVVTLKSDVKIDKSDSSKDGSEPGKAIVLK